MDLAGPPHSFHKAGPFRSCHLSRLISTLGGVGHGFADEGFARGKPGDGPEIWPDPDQGLPGYCPDRRISSAVPTGLGRSRHRRVGARNEAFFPGRVPHVRSSVHGPKIVRGVAPSNAFGIAKRLRPGARVLAGVGEALEKSVFGPWSRISCTGCHQRMRMKFVDTRESNRKSGCTLRRTWGTRPEPSTVVGSLDPAGGCRCNLNRLEFDRRVFPTQGLCVPDAWIQDRHVGKGLRLG